MDVSGSVCHVTKRQLMPPPRLPRHLRPCRPLWSARQVRFASDKPHSSRPAAGGDAATTSARPQATAPSSTRPSQAQRMRTRMLLGGPKASSSSSIGISSNSTSNNIGISSTSDSNTTSNTTSTSTSTKPALRIRRFLVSRESGRSQGAISAYLAKEDELEAAQLSVQTAQQSGSSAETETRLRQRVEALEEQLATLLKTLQASSAPSTDPPQSSQPPQPPQATGAAHSEPTADAPKSDRVRAASQPGDTAGGVDSTVVAQSHDAAAATSNVARTSKSNTTTPAKQIQAQSKSPKSLKSSKSSKSSSHPQPSRPAPRAPSTASDHLSEQSLLDELFPEANSQLQPDLPDKRPSPPKLDLPAPSTDSRIRLAPYDARTDREKAIDAFRTRGEQTTILQLSNCSTALTESDFRRLIPRGLHIDTWSRDGDFYKIIPGRDPLSLARLPIYYLLFHSSESALAYQKSASRLSKLSALHAPNSIHSAIMPPAGFLEDGEDIHAVTSSFVLHPQGHQLDLRTVMQPYNRALRALVDAGGYTPIVPNVDENGKKIHRVLLHIDGYEPSHWDLWQIISRHAHARGILWPFRNEHAGALRRLRDCINLKTVSKIKLQDISTANPRATASLNVRGSSEAGGFDYEDAHISALLGTSSGSSKTDAQTQQETNQLVMNRVYNRWIVELDDEDAARRFAGLWHRVVLPDAKDKKGAWKEAEEERWVQAEYLW